MQKNPILPPWCSRSSANIPSNCDWPGRWWIYVGSRLRSHLPRSRRDCKSSPGRNTALQHHNISLPLSSSHADTPQQVEKIKVAHTRLPSAGFRSWSRFLAVSLQVAWVIDPAVGCHYFPPRLQLPPQPLRGLLPISLLGEQRHDGCEQFA